MTVRKVVLIMQHCSIKKILVMVSLTLSIICSVFYLCKKVGLCEEPEVISYNPPPFIYGHGICNGGATQETLLYVLDNAITRYTKYVIGDPVIVLWSNDNFWVIFLNCTDNIYTHSKPSDFSVAFALAVLVLRANSTPGCTRLTSSIKQSPDADVCYWRHDSRCRICC